MILVSRTKEGKVRIIIKADSMHFIFSAYCFNHIAVLLEKILVGSIVYGMGAVQFDFL